MLYLYLPGYAGEGDRARRAWWLGILIKLHAFRHRQMVLQAESLDRVIEQAGDGHGADALRHRRDSQSAILGAVEIDIADQLAFTVYLNAVDADIDHIGID